MLLAAAGAAAFVSTASQAATYTFNKTSGGPYDWSTAANWTATPAGSPNAAGDAALVTSDLTANVILNINAPVTVGSLNLGDNGTVSNVITLGGSSPLTFDNGGAAVLTVLGAPAGSVNAITTTVAMSSDLSIVNRASGAFVVPVISVNGTTANTRTLALDLAGVGDPTGLGNITASNALADGSLGAKLALAQRNSGTTTLSGLNSYSGGTTVAAGVLQAIQSASTNSSVFGTGNIALNGGKLLLAPGGSSSSVTMAAVTGAGKTFSYGGGGYLTLTRGSNTAMSFVVGDDSSPANSVLSRTGAGTLIIVPTNGDLSTEKFIVKGGVVQAGGIVSPTIVAQTSAASTVGDYLVHDTTNGFARATYTSRNGTFAATVNELTNVTASATINTSSPSILRLGAALKIGSAQTVTVGQGGVLLNSTSGITVGSSATSVLQFAGVEAAIYAGAAAPIDAKISADSGLTKFGASTLTLSNSNNTITGGIRINNGGLTVSNPGALGSTSNTITLMPSTILTINASAFNGQEIKNNIVVNGGHLGTSSSWSYQRPFISSGGSDWSTARTLSGSISSGTAAETSAAGGVVFDAGWTKLSGDNSGFAGQMRLSQARVMIESATALGTGDGTSNTGVRVYHGSSIFGVRGGLTIPNEYIQVTVRDVADGFGSFHAFSNPAGGNQVVTWGGPVALENDSIIGADSGVTLRLTGPVTAGQYPAFKKVGPGTVELSSNGNAFGDHTAVVAVLEVRGGTVRVSNTDLTKSATGKAPIEVQNGSTLEGSGSVFGDVMVRSGGYLKPGTSAGTLTTLGGGATGGQTWFGTTTAMGGGSVYMESGSHLVMEMATAGYDKLSLTANSTKNQAILSSAIEFALDPSFEPVAGQNYDLVTARTITYQGGLQQDANGYLAVTADNLQAQLDALAQYPNFVRVAGTPDDPFEYSYQLIQNPNTQTDILRVQFAAVPEPGALGLLAAGGLGLIGRRRRRA